MNSNRDHDHDTQLQHPFFDNDSRRAVQWDALWATFDPVTPYGKHWKTTAQPFLPGDEVACQRALDQLSCDAEQLAVDTVAHVTTRLRELPDLYDVLRTLQSNGAVLSAKQILALKQFAKRGLDMTADERCENINWTYATAWSSVLTEFGEPDSPSFSILHVANDEYREVARKYAEATQALYVATKQRDMDWLHRTGYRATRDGQLILPLPECRALTCALKEERVLTWLRDTPFESVFSVPMSTEMEQVQVELCRTKARLERLEDGLLQQLTDVLRIHLPTWERLVKDVTELDVRLAKVRLLHQWQGSVPELTGIVSLQQAVHPLVAGRLHGTERKYVPLNLEVAFGANVLCGSNMGGKTVAMSLLVLCQCLAQYAMPIPARAFTTQLFRMVRFCGAVDGDVQSGLSAFGREVVRLSAVWEAFNALQPALVCLDEPGKTTNPMEGEALVVALVRQATRSEHANNLLFVATHFPAAIRVAGAAVYQVKGLNDASLDEERVRLHAQRIEYLEQHMDYRIERMTEPTAVQEALRVAAWLGLPQDLLQESHYFLQRGMEDGVKTLFRPCDGWARAEGGERDR